MNFLKGLAAAAAVVVLVIAFRDAQRGRWLTPALPAGGAALDDREEEPILGYDGMDVETLRDWVADAALDRATLLRMRAYEEAHFGREGVLAAIDDQLG